MVARVYWLGSSIITVLSMPNAALVDAEGFKVCASIACTRSFKRYRGRPAGTISDANSVSDTKMITSNLTVSILMAQARPNARAEAGRVECVQYETGAEPRPCLQHAR